LEGREGDPALPWWKEVWRWASSLPVVVGPGMQVTQIPGMGTQIKVKTAAPVRIFFEVVLSGSRISVRPGMLEGEVPFIKTTSGDYVDLMGRKFVGGEAGTPFLDLTDAKPGPDGRSCIALLALVDANNRLLDPLSRAVVRIEHRSEFGRRQKREAEIDRAPFHELAILYWRDGKPERVAQVVQHNLGLAYGPTADENSPRFFFYAAG
jgi:hypothetical protein